MVDAFAVLDLCEDRGTAVPDSLLAPRAGAGGRGEVTYLIRAASLSMMLRSAPTASARSVYTATSQRSFSTRICIFPSSLSSLSSPSPGLKSTYLVYDQTITPRNPRAPLAWNLIPSRNINNINDVIRQLPAIIGSQIVPPALNQ